MDLRKIISKALSEEEFRDYIILPEFYLLGSLRHWGECLGARVVRKTYNGETKAAYAQYFDICDVINSTIIILPDGLKVIALGLYNHYQKQYFKIFSNPLYDAGKGLAGLVVAAMECGAKSAHSSIVSPMVAEGLLYKKKNISIRILPFRIFKTKIKLFIEVWFEDVPHVDDYGYFFTPEFRFFDISTVKQYVACNLTLLGAPDCFIETIEDDIALDHITSVTIKDGKDVFHPGEELLKNKRPLRKWQ